MLSRHLEDVMSMSRQQREKFLPRWRQQMKPPQHATSGAAMESATRAADVTGTVTYDRFTRVMKLHLDLDRLRDLVDGGKP